MSPQSFFLIIPCARGKNLPLMMLPQRLANRACNSSDLWAIGCILYQMISGAFPFQGASNYLMWVKVKTLDFTFPNGFDVDARDLVLKLLVRSLFVIVH